MLPAAGPDAERLAGRFAAKEATMKVLRPGADDAVPWTAIEVRRDPAGIGRGRAARPRGELACARGRLGLAVSLTHEDGIGRRGRRRHGDRASGG